MKLSLSNIGAALGVVSTVAGIVVGVAAWHKDKVRKDMQLQELNRTVTEQVIPTLIGINDKLNTMATSDQVDALNEKQEATRQDVNTLLKYNEEALKEIKERKEIDDLTIRKADAYDEIKKNVTR